MSTLTSAEAKALVEALDDEYLAWATYDQVIVDFGEVAPHRHTPGARARYGLPSSASAACGPPAKRVSPPRSPTAPCTTGCSGRAGAPTSSRYCAISSKHRNSATSLHSGVVRKPPRVVEAGVARGTIGAEGGEHEPDGPPRGRMPECAARR